MNQYLKLSPEIEAALETQKPIIALESTLIAHGLPYPQNIDIAIKMEHVIREEGGIPATIGILNGQIKIGLSSEEIEELATSSSVFKVSSRDLGKVLALKEHGATTVAATMRCAHIVGIRFFATGGIGGVHRGAEQTGDISADLTELHTTPVAVVCAGAKSILDLPRTLEYLETMSVPVVTMGQDEFPAFYSRSSGLSSPIKAENYEEAAQIVAAHWSLGSGGVLIACPIPEAYAIETTAMEQLIEQALEKAHEKGISGPKLTPFLLREIGENSQGESVQANSALLINNARQAAKIAIAYSKLVPSSRFQ